jgi:hypothetical protein
VERPGAWFVVPAARRGAHHRRIVEAHGPLDESEALFGFLHLRHVLGVISQRLAGHRETHGSVVRADAVMNLATEQFIYGHAGRLTGRYPRAKSRSRSRPTPRV